MRKVVLLLLVAAALAAALWITCAWVPADGALLGWSSTDGTLLVPSRGPAWIPRWRYHRVDGGEIGGTLDGASREGVRVSVSLGVRPAVGRWRLAPAATPREGLLAAAREPARAYLATVPLGCLVPGVAAKECPQDPTAGLRAAVGEVVSVPLGDISVKLAPDASAVRGFLLGKVHDRLPEVRRKLLVIGLDAVGWDHVLPYVKQGLMPNLKRLMGQGTWGEMKTLVPMLSPLIWTTMATGYPPEEHGILDFVQRDPKTGEMVPTTSRERKVPAVWNLASALGKTSDVVAWWATWPAERLDGVMVSDRLYYSLTQGLAKEVFERRIPDVVSPPDRAQRFVELRDSTEKETDWQDVRGFIDIPEQAYKKAVSSGEGWSDPVDGFRRTLIATRLYFGSALMLAPDRSDLLMVYIEGTDEIGHIMAPYMPPPRVDVSPARAAMLTASVPRYFQTVDRWIGRLVAACPLDQYTVMVLSDHGFRWGKDRPKGISATSGPTAARWHKQPAIYLLAGRDVARLGHVRDWKSVFDVAPTIAAIIGIPPDEHWRGTLLPGTPKTGLKAIDYAPLVPPSSYQSGGHERTPMSPEYIAKLKSLGYLSGGGDQPLVSAGEAARTPPPTKTPSPTPTPIPTGAGNDATTTFGELNNLAIIKLNQGKVDEAKRILDRMTELYPNRPITHYHYHRLYLLEKRFDDADRELWLAIDRGMPDLFGSLDRAAAEYEDIGMEERAERVLEEAVKRFPEYEQFWGHLMVAKLRLHKCAEAAELGKTAAARFPNSGPIHAFYGTAAACAGDAATAEAEIERSLQINPEQPTLRQMLQQLRQGGR